jgi:hypothetical protein
MTLQEQIREQLYSKIVTMRSQSHEDAIKIIEAHDKRVIDAYKERLEFAYLKADKEYKDFKLVFETN